MKLFISWSGERSGLLAESLRRWIPQVINAVEPWLSSSDISPGTRWSPEIASQLEQTRFGIVCLTRENLNAPWLLFEAGALAKIVDKSRVVPLLLDNKPTDIQGPLAQFQGIQATRSHIKKLVLSINSAVYAESEKALEEPMLAESFDVWWPKLENALNEIPKEVSTTPVSTRSDRDVIEEILGLVRGIRNELVHTSIDVPDEISLTYNELVDFFRTAETDPSLLRVFYDRLSERNPPLDSTAATIAKVINNMSAGQRKKFLNDLNFALRHGRKYPSRTNDTMPKPDEGDKSESEDSSEKIG